MRLLAGIAIMTIAWAAIICALIVLFAPLAHAAECQVGVASWYGPESGGVTASGERFDPEGLTAASRTLPFGTILLVRNMGNGRSVRVRVTDRGPALWTHRLVDLSRGAARRLGMIRTGVAKVCIGVWDG